MTHYIGATGLDIFEDAISDAIEETTNTLTTLIITQDNLQAGYSSNYVLSTSNILVERITDEVDFTSNYVLSTSNILVKRIHDTSNYVLSTSNILVQRTKQLEDRVDDLEGGEGSAGDPNADPPIPPIPPTGNFAILATLGVLTAGATALAIVVADLTDDVNDLDDKVDLNNIYTSNYVKITSNILVKRITDEADFTSNYVKITSNILVKRITDEADFTSNYVKITSNILVKRITDEVGFGSNYVLNTSNILVKRITDEVGFGSNYVLSTSNILVKRITDEVGFGSNYVLSTSNILVPRIMQEVGFTSNYVLSTSNILVPRIMSEVGFGSNYVLSTSNILVPRIMTEVGYTSNYVARINTELTTAIGGKQATLSAGSGITIVSNTISATSTSSYWTNINTNDVYYNLTGKVGVGINNPASKLHVYDNVANTTTLTIQNNFNSGAITATPSATTTGTTGIYTYMSFTYNKPIIEQITGVSGWRLVRFLPPTATVWHPINDDLVGTTTYGTAYSTTTAWSIPFGTFDEFVFGTLNLQYWMQITKTQAVGEIYAGTARTIIKSSFSATSYSATQYNRGAGNGEDPWMSIQNHPTQVVYGENSVAGTHTQLISVDGGMGVWVRNSADASTFSQSSYNVNFPENTICDILIIGGGGGGAKTDGGGGGAGGLLYIQNTTLTGNYTINVGKGGLGGVGSGQVGIVGAKGTNTSCIGTNANYIAYGGGGGAYGYPSDIEPGNFGPYGSSGGLGTGDQTRETFNVNTSGQGYLGGLGTAATGGGGGGGSGGVGVNSGNGGIGTQINITGTNLYYAGGGGGGHNPSGTTGGLGGGGSATYYIGNNATYYGGGGGGGGANFGNGGNGFEGIIIIRYISPSSSSSIELINGTTTDANNDWKLGNYAGDFKIISSVSGTPSDRLTIKSSGYVGIGTTNPTNILQVGSGGRLRIANDTADQTIIGSDDVASANSSRIELKGSTRPYYGGSDNGNIWYYANGFHLFYVNNVEMMRFTANSVYYSSSTNVVQNNGKTRLYGNVGIGSVESATYKLYVNGSQYTSDSITANGGVITNNISSYGTNGPLVIDPNYTTNNYIQMYDDARVQGVFSCSGSIHAGTTYTCGGTGGGYFRFECYDNWIRLKSNFEDHRDLAIGTLYAHYDIYGRFTSISNTGNDYLCIQQNASSVGQGLHGIIRSAYGTFTGFHRCYTDDELYNGDTDENIDVFKNNFMGRVVIATGKIKTDLSRDVVPSEPTEPDTSDIKKAPDTEWYSLIDKDGITIEDAVPVVALSRKKKDKRVFGVFGGTKRNTNNKNRLIVNSVGEGAICVSNTNGNIENGDYIQSSDLLGYGEKQDDDLMHNYTIAKATIDCNFELDSPYYQCHEIENDVRVAFIVCSYHCG